MEEKYFDQHKIYCFICKHLWKLSSDKKLTEEQIDNWMIEVMKEHSKIHEELEQ